MGKCEHSSMTDPNKQTDHSLILSEIGEQPDESFGVSESSSMVLVLDEQGAALSQRFHCIWISSDGLLRIDAQSKSGRTQ